MLMANVGRWSKKLSEAACSVAIAASRVHLMCARLRSILRLKAEMEGDLRTVHADLREELFFS